MREINGLKIYTEAEVAGLKRFGETDINKGDTYCEPVPPWIHDGETMYTINVADNDIHGRVMFAPYIPGVAYPAGEHPREPTPICSLSENATEQELTMYLFHVRSTLKKWQKNHRGNLFGRNAIYAIKAACNAAVSGYVLSDWVNSLAVRVADEDLADD